MRALVLRGVSETVGRSTALLEYLAATVVELRVARALFQRLKNPLTVVSLRGWQVAVVVCA